MVSHLGLPVRGTLSSHSLGMSRLFPGAGPGRQDPEFGIASEPLRDAPSPYRGLQLQGPAKHINIKKCFPETGFDLLRAVPGRRVTFHD